MAAPRRAQAIHAVSFLLVAAIALVVVTRFGYRYPYSDDWDLVVPALDGEHAVELPWLWAQHNEHRLPLPKLALIAADAVTHGDFRGGPVANWLLLVAAALLAWRALRRGTHGAPWWAAATVAAIALNPSNNAFRWGVELQFVASAVLMMLAIWATMTTPPEAAPRAWRVGVVGLASLLLPLTGGNGVLFAVAAIAGTVFVGLRATSAAARAIAALCVALGVALVAGYFVGYRSPPNHESLGASSVVQLAVVFAHLLVAPFGPYASRLIALTAPAALLAIGLAVALLWRAVRDHRVTPTAFAGVLVALSGTLLVFGAIALGRGARGWPAGLETHYASLGIPLWLALCAGLVAAGARLLPAAIGVVATAGILVALPIGPPPPYVALGHSFRPEWCAGASTDVLAHRYIALFYYVDTPESQAIVAAKLARLRAARPDLWPCDLAR
jgi:hypothetical protein